MGEFRIRVDENLMNEQDSDSTYCRTFYFHLRLTSSSSGYHTVSCGGKSTEQVLDSYRS